MSEWKPVILHTEMPHEMQQDAVDCAKQALEKYEELVVSQDIEIMCLVCLLVGWLVGKFRALIHCLFFRMLLGI
jgi:hypothetical protein